MFSAEARGARRRQDDRRSNLLYSSQSVLEGHGAYSHMAPSITHYRDRTDTKPDPVHRHDVRRWIFEENHGGAAWRVYMCLAFTYRRPLIPLLRRRLRGALRQRDLEGLCLFCVGGLRAVERPSP